MWSSSANKCAEQAFLNECLPSYASPIKGKPDPRFGFDRLSDQALDEHKLMLIDSCLHLEPFLLDIVSRLFTLFCIVSLQQAVQGGRLTILQTVHSKAGRSDQSYHTLDVPGPSGNNPK